MLHCVLILLYMCSHMQRNAQVSRLIYAKTPLIRKATHNLRHPFKSSFCFISNMNAFFLPVIYLKYISEFVTHDKFHLEVVLDMTTQFQYKQESTTYESFSDQHSLTEMGDLESQEEDAPRRVLWYKPMTGGD